MTSKTWTSGLKQRLETPNPIAGGSMVAITRVDKGVTWKIDLAQKIYEEKPIALVYKPEPPKSSSSISTGKDLPSDDTKTEDRFEIRPIPGSRAIAGFPATGYEMTVNQKPTGRMWMADPTGMLAQVDKESAAFQEAYNKKLYENYPAAERADIASGMKMLGDMFKGAFSAAIPGVSQLPKGVPLAMENMTEDDDRQHWITVFEVLKVSVTPISNDWFEVPLGFQKVDDLAAHQMQHLLKGNNLEEMMKHFQKSGVSDHSDAP